MEVAWIIAGDGRPIRPRHGSVACVESNVPRPRTRESHCRRAILHEIIAQFFTRQDLLVRSGLDDRINLGIAAYLITQLVFEAGVLCQLIRGQRRSVGKCGVDSPRLQKGVRRSEVLAARDSHTAQPIPVGAVAGRTVAGKRILLCVVGFAWDELHGFIEAIVERKGIVIVELAQSGRIGECLVVAGNGVGNLVAKSEVEDQCAITIG